jgi:hypothetical protein
MQLDTLKIILPNFLTAGKTYFFFFSKDNEKKPFITTDAPVPLTTVAPRENSIWGLGCGNADALVPFPLTESRAFWRFTEVGETSNTGRQASNRCAKSTWPLQPIANALSSVVTKRWFGLRRIVCALQAGSGNRRYLLCHISNVRLITGSAAS